MRQDPFFHIGFGNVALADHIIYIGKADAVPMKRIIQEARERNVLIDATNGRKAKSIIITDSNHVILSTIHSKTLQKSRTSSWTKR
ncbi:DUF370 domain-containing protein [Salicibibacter halophilus]|uniref:DUF370 domain-containing protein n=1 Tax=Salicibibacter halophilus TaxID=2502791 RepID=A0A514LE83_9BACI|nr:extracellular matrix/biofilm biosynthesis regulator RemA family protein [Salicibibacter halophilus]QDI90154.1 DUF370 domain-containing protein [Salicibibacter halophilus]